MKKIISLIIALLLTGTAFAADKTVNTAGEDYDTIADCVSNIGPGDRCLIYDDQGPLPGATISNSGSAGGGYLYIIAAPGESPVTTSGFGIGNSSYIWIEKLYINGSIANGSGATAHHIAIIDNTIDGNGADLISLNVTQFLISGNTFVDLQSEDGIRTFGDNGVVRNNKLLNQDDSENQHLDLWQTGCWGGDGAADMLFENNEFRNITGPNVHGFLSNQTSSCNHPTTNHIYRENHLWGVGEPGGTYPGIWIDNNSQAAGSGHNVSYNNTFGNLYGGNQTDPNYDIVNVMNGSDDSHAVNNLNYNAMYRTDARFVAWASGGSQWYNSYYDTHGTFTLQNPETGALLNQDPLLNDPDNGNYGFQANSPNKGRGGPLTYVASSDPGSGTSLDLDNSDFFWPGNDLTDGDIFYTRRVARLNNGFLIDFESGNNLDGMDLSYMASVTHGASGTWSYRYGSLHFYVDTGWYGRTAYPTYVQGAWFDDSSGSRSAIFNDNTTASNHYQYYWGGSGYTKVSVGAFVKAPDYNHNGYFADFLLLVSGTSNGENAYCVAQWRDDGTPFIQAHTWVTGIGTKYGGRIEYPPDQKIWATLLYDEVSGLCRVSAYDPTDWSQIDSEAVAGGTGDLAGYNVHKFQFGNNPHAVAVTGSHSYDNIMVDFDGKYPLFPTRAAQTAQIVSKSGNTVTITPSIARMPGDEVGLYARSDGTVVYSGNGPDIGASAYQTGGQQNHRGGGAPTSFSGSIR